METKIMAQVYILDSVIKRLRESEVSKYVSSSTKKLVIVDARNKEVLEKKPLISFGRQLEFFLVSSGSDRRNIAESNISGFSIVDFATDQNIDISVKYEVSCLAGKEEEVVLALFDSTDTVGVIFEGKLISWLKEYESINIKFSEFTTNYAQQLLDLQKYAVGEAKGIGLNLKLRLSLRLDESDQLKPFSVESSDFPILLNNFEEEVNFRFRANLSIVDNGKVNAILSYNQLGKLKDILQEAVQVYFRQNVSLYNFCYNFEESTRKGLVANLDQVLALHGRKIEGFFPSPDLAAHLRMPEPDPIQCDVQHEIQGYGLVIIKNVLEVEPKHQNSKKSSEESILRYQKARILDVQKWFKAKLEKTIHSYLFDFSYVDILLKYDSRSIKAQLDEEAESIGYEIRLISTVPDLKPLKLRTEGFRFESSETFYTRQNSVKIKLGINIRGKIENLESIKDILNDPQNDVNALIAKEVIDSIQIVLHGVEPADFYAQEGLISYVDDYSSGEAIKNKVVNAISGSLKEKFGASSQITLQALNTELLDLINELTRGADHGFEILLASSRDAGEKILFTGLFQINGVAKDQWDTFATRKPSVEDVKKSIQDYLRQWFHTLSTTTLNYQTTKGLRQLLENANTLAVPKIMQKYGLLISIEGLEAPDTKSKTVQRELQLDSEMKILEEAKEQIQNDGQLREIERRISINDITHLNQDLESVRELLRDLSTQPGGEERKKKLVERERELKSQLSQLVEENRKKAAEIAAQQMQRSIKLSIEESDFDALVQDSKALLPEETGNSGLKPSNRVLPDDDQTIDV
jgi:hypothetical protein